MIIVDSSVWIDYFNGTITPQSDKLDSLLGYEPIAIGDIILTEVLQGFSSDKDFNQAKALFANIEILNMLGEQNALKSAENFRYLRKKGITIRKTIDCIIATYCIENKYRLLFSDRDFLPFAEYLKLQIVS
jgi:predicted nucleic acid-binding protein